MGKSSREREREIYIYISSNITGGEMRTRECAEVEREGTRERERQVKPLHHSPGEKERERESERETERSMKTWKEEMMIKNVLRFS